MEAKISISQPDVNLTKINVTISDQLKTPQRETIFHAKITQLIKVVL